MLWEKIKYGKAVQRDAVECGAILGGKPVKASLVRWYSGRAGYNEGLSPVEMGAGFPVTGHRCGHSERLNDELNLKSLLILVGLTLEPGLAQSIVQHLTMHETAPTIQNYLAPNLKCQGWENLLLEVRQSLLLLCSQSSWCCESSTFLAGYWSKSLIEEDGWGITESSEWHYVQTSLEVGEEKWKAWQPDHSRYLCMKS